MASFIIVIHLFSIGHMMLNKNLNKILQFEAKVIAANHFQHSGSECFTNTDYCKDCVGYFSGCS